MGNRCFSGVYLLQHPPGCITTSEFFSILEQRIQISEMEYEEANNMLIELLNTAKNTGIETDTLQYRPNNPISKIAFWDLTQIEHLFPLLAADPLFLPGLMDYLRGSKMPHNNEIRKITSLIMGAPNISISRAAANYGDNVVFCWRDVNKNSEKSGVLFYADRISGQPGITEQIFVEDPTERQTNVQVNEKDKCKLENFLHARGMVKAIGEMQGLSYQEDWT